MNCEEVCEKIAQMAKGDLPLSEKTIVENHIFQCPSCKKESVKHAKLVKGLKSFYAKLNLEPNRTIQCPFISETAKISPFNLIFFRTYAFPAFLLCFVGALLSFLSFQYQGPSLIPGNGISHSAISAPPLGSPIISFLSGELIEMKSRKAIKSQAQLSMGETYIVTENAILSHPTHARICLPVNTVFQVVKNGFILQKGGARFEGHLKGTRFQVTLPTAVLGILGTRFDVIIVGSYSLIQLFEGTLLVEGKGGKLILEPGEVCWVNDQEGTLAASTSLDLWGMFQKSVTASNGKDLFLASLKERLKDFPARAAEPRPLVASSAETSSTFSVSSHPFERNPVNSATSSVASSPAEESSGATIPQDSSSTTQVQTPEEGILK